jgi:hypothetical protein
MRAVRDPGRRSRKQRPDVTLRNSLRDHEAAARLRKGASCLHQMGRFDAFVRVYNNERPHQALNGACPGDIYTPSARLYRPPEEPQYPFHDRTVRVTRCGRICIGKRKINLSTVFAGQIVGIREVDDQIWLVSFMHYDLGYFDLEQKTLQPLDNPFGTRLSPMS